MILNHSITARASNRKHTRPGYCRVNVAALNRGAQSRPQGLSARQVRNACVLGCVAGLVFCVAVCALLR